MDGSKTIYRSISMNVRLTRIRLVISWAMSVILLFLFTRAGAQVTDVESIAIAKGWATKLGVDTRGLESRAKLRTAARTGSRYYIVSVGEVTMTIDAANGALLGLAAVGRAAEISEGIDRLAPDKYLTREQCSARLLEIMKILGYENSGYIQDSMTIHTEDSSVNPDLRGTCVAAYSPRPFGRNPNGKGNFVEVQFDVQDGQVVLLRVASGWSYRDARLIITQSRAVEIATSLMEQYFPGKPRSITNTRLGFVFATRDFGSTTGASLTKSKITPYAYIVTFGGFAVYIDPETGACLGGAY